MKHAALVSLTVIGCAAAVAASDTRTLSGSVPAAPLKVVSLDSTIGDVEINAVDGASEVRIDVQLTPRRGGFFSSKRRAEREVEEASLSARVKGSKLELFVAPKAEDDRRFEENWSIELPTGIAIEIDHGVGDIVVRNTDSPINIDSGVGDVRLEIAGGDIGVDLGVGTAVVKAPAGAFKTVEGSGGVGDASLTVKGKKISGSGFVGHSASWDGTGPSHMEVSVGVGDAVITLE